jgi:hypothetical protein
MAMTTASRPFQQTHTALLQDPKRVAHYLEEALAVGDAEAFELAMRNVAEARSGGMTAAETEIEFVRDSSTVPIKPGKSGHRDLAVGFGERSGEGEYRGIY